MAASPELSDMRFAHTEGVCDLVFAPDGRVVTCGADGEVRVYAGIEDEDPASHLVGDEALAVACSDEAFYVSCSDNINVQAYELAGGASKGRRCLFDVHTWRTDSPNTPKADVVLDIRKRYGPKCRHGAQKV